ncbi:MAG: type II secretion system F family protein [Hyphomicrobiaceae bacterium]|nr:type II secretion system F family protein [Hyphomicrobiaceae bacterium]
MPNFRYRAVTQAGEVVVGEVEAPTREEVLKRIEYLGHLPVDAEAVANSTWGLANALWNKGARPRDITMFLRQLAVLVGAGLTLEAALQTLADDTSKGPDQFATALRSAISAGDSFADALARHPAIVESAYVAMVRAGEASGKLDAVLRAIVEDRVRRELLAERVGSAIRYPLFLVISAVLVLFFFLIYVVPQFEPVFNDLGGKLNVGAAFVVSASSWLNANLDLFLGQCLALVLGTWLVLRKGAWRDRVVAAMSALPGIAGPVGDRRTARIIGTLGLLIDNGVTLPTALKILREVITDPHYVAAVDGVHEQVRNGRRFADALADTDLLPPLATRMLRVGDEASDLPSIAKHAAELYEHRLAVGLDRLMGAVGPLTIILVSTVIGGLIVSIMSALLSITELAL